MNRYGRKMDRRKAPLSLALAVPMKTIQITGTPLQLMQERIKQPKNQMRKMIDLIEYTVIRECDNSIVTFPYFFDDGEQNAASIHGLFYIR